MPNVSISNLNGCKIIQVEKGHRLSIINGKTYVDGHEVDLNGDLHELKNIENCSLTINGDVDTIQVEQIASIEVHGDVKKDVRTNNGDVKADNICGSVSTVNGDINTKKIGGSVSTVNGDISRSFF